jgi:hypothetical protein
MRKITFIAMLLCMSAACLLIGGIALYENIDYRLHSQRATMELADPSKKLIISTGGYDVHLIDVRYVSPSGSLVFPSKRLSGEIARQLAGGAKIPVTYLTNNPQHADFTEVERPSAWGWFGLGLALLAVFAYAVKLRRREAHQ